MVLRRLIAWLDSDWSSIRFAAFCSVIFVVIYNVAFFSDVISLINVSSIHQLLFGISLVLVVGLLIFFLLNLFTFPFLTKPIFVLLVLGAAATSYFMNAYGLVVHKLIIQDVMETDAGEVREVMSPLLFVNMMLLGILPAIWLLRRRICYQSLRREIGLKIMSSGAALLASLLIILCFSAQYASFFRNHKEIREKVNPLNFMVAIVSYLRDSEKPLQLETIGSDAHLARSVIASTKPKLVVLVVGETARADHFSMNNYARDTTPQLARENLINYRQVYSCGTETAVSVPCMFSLLDRRQYSDRKAKSQETVLDVIQRAGVAVLWRDNNSSCKGVCDRVAYEDMRKLSLEGVCNSRECFDEVLLHDLAARIDSLPNLPGGKLVVLHQKGSHGPDYYNRYPAAKEAFSPACKTNLLHDCSRQEVVNAFDNTIHYTDQFLGDVIAELKRLSDHYDTALVYLSDHGESLGENKIYLHGMPYMLAPAAQKHIPFFFWFSPAFAADAGVDTRCLRQRTEDEYSQDNLFHTLLGLMDVETSVYQTQLDMLSGCRVGAQLSPHLAAGDR